MKQKKKTVKHNFLEFGTERRVYLAKIDEGYSVAFERPLQEIDKGEAPQFSKIHDDKVITHMALTEDALEALLHLYNEHKGYNGTSLTYTLNIMSNLLNKAASINDSNKHT